MATRFDFTSTGPFPGLTSGSVRDESRLRGLGAVNPRRRVSSRTDRGFNPGSAALAAISIALFLSGCRGTPKLVAPKPEVETHLISFHGQSGLEIGAESAGVAGVTTAPAEVQDLHATVQPTGQVAATDSDAVQVTSRLPGKVVDALVSVGMLVRQGQLIARVDSVDLTQAEATYQTALAHARLTYNQLQQQRKLARYGALSEQPIEDARKAYAAAQAAVAGDQAQLALDRTTLANTRQLIQMGEITRKPVEDAQNAYAQAHAARVQSQVTLQSTKANFDRAKILFNGGIYSKQQLEDAETAYNNAVASVEQNTTQEKLASEELDRQKNIYKQNLNGAASLQQAQSKLQQDQHTYQNDLTAQRLAHTQLIRAETVHRSGIPINQALQQAQDAYDEARVAVSGAEETLRLYGVRPGEGAAQLQNGHVIIPVVSPISGIVVARNMVVGQLTDTSTPLARVVNLRRVYVDAQVYETEIGEIAVGNPIRLRVAAYPYRLFTGRVQYVGNEVNPDTRTLTVRTVIPNPGGLLRPGMFATMLIGSGAGRHSLAIPADAVLQQGAHQVVYVQVTPRQFVKRTVRVGAAVNGRVPVRSGVSPGERVVVSGNVLLQREQEKLESEKRAAA
jgi:cobalt-zinc-cadmium efflux system membrane fusion protein